MRIARVDARPGARIGAGAPAVLRAGDHVGARVRRQFEILSSARVDVHKRGALLPVFGRGVDLDDERIGRPAFEDGALVAGKWIGRDRLAERKPVLRIEPVLVLRRGAARHREAVIGEHLAGARDMRQHAVEDALAAPVLVHAEFEEMA